MNSQTKMNLFLQMDKFSLIFFFVKENKLFSDFIFYWRNFLTQKCEMQLFIINLLSLYGGIKVNKVFTGVRVTSKY